MRILIAEDETVSRRLLEISLEKGGHDVVSCSDGTEAWNILQQGDAPKLAILDWMMPGMEGVEICRQARKLTHGSLLYLIVLTTKGRKEDVVEGLEAGANDYITKPFDQQELQARVQVGARVVDLQERLLEAERHRVLTQAAGAAAHEINQPLTVLMGTAQLLEMRMSPDDPNRESVEILFRAGERVSEIVKKMGDARQYVTKPYVSGIDIIDFDAAAGNESGEGDA
jgi:DNA-binding response OmpR family regulator